MSTAARPADMVDGDVRRNPGEPSPEQAEADAYKKPRVQWRGLTIAIENPAGSVRRGTNRHGVGWEIRMRYDYGEVVGSMGVDGDPVDIYLGPALEDAPMVYVVHQRKVGRWDEYDEDKAMAGFLTEEDAKQAFLSNYNDPRFLGPVTAMPVDEFIEKVKATKEKPAMIKAIFVKAHVDTYTRKDGTVVEAHEDRRTAHPEADTRVRGGVHYDTTGMPDNGRGMIRHEAERLSTKMRDAGFHTKIEHDEEDGKPYSAVHVHEPDTGYKHSPIVVAGHHVKRMGYDDQSAGSSDFDNQVKRASLDRDDRRADKGIKPGATMAKAILFFKGYVGPYLRGGRIVNARGYHGRQARAQAHDGQMSLFGGPMSGKPLGPSPLNGKDAVAHTPDMFDEPHHAEQTHGLDSKKRLLDHSPESHGDSHSYGSNVIAKRPAGHWAYSNEHGTHQVMYSVGRGQYTSTDRLESKDEALKQAHQHMKARGLVDEPQHTEPTRELIAEHERLVDVLNSPSHADDEEEAKKQGDELEEMKREFAQTQNKQPKPIIFLGQAPTS